LYVKKFPNIKRKLRMATLKDTPEDFVKKAMKSALTLAMLITIVVFFFLSSFGKSLVSLIAIFPSLLLLFFLFMMHTPDVYIRKRQKEIEKEVLLEVLFRSLLRARYLQLTLAC